MSSPGSDDRPALSAPELHGDDHVPPFPAQAPPRPVSSILDTIGNTPLLRGGCSCAPSCLEVGRHRFFWPAASSLPMTLTPAPKPAVHLYIDACFAVMLGLSRSDAAGYWPMRAVSEAGEPEPRRERQGPNWCACARVLCMHVTHGRGRAASSQGANLQHTAASAWQDTPAGHACIASMHACATQRALTDLPARPARVRSTVHD
jgi:hypothetical protein